MAGIRPRQHLQILKGHGVSLPEWYVLSSIGMWPIPFSETSKIVASHSEGDPRGSVTERQCRDALAACIATNWLRVMDKNSITGLQALVAKKSLLGPIYGYPNPQDVDFTPNGASLYLRVRRQLTDGN